MNKRMRTPEENLYRMESKLHNMRWQMEKIRNMVIDKAMEN